MRSSVCRERAGRLTPNLSATQVELTDGLVAMSQNRWPLLAFDAGTINDVFSLLFWPSRSFTSRRPPRSPGAKIPGFVLFAANAADGVSCRRGSGPKKVLVEKPAP
jgi:hypothetical protein